MDRARLHELLTQVRDGTIDVDHALDALKTLPFEDLGFARIDHHRALPTEAEAQEITSLQAKTLPDDFRNHSLALAGHP